MQLSTSNLMPATTPYSRRVKRAPSVMMDYFRIRDRTQSASISLT
nr:MAG TPA: hypothetical protein [Caudoviricetes sp.]